MSTPEQPRRIRASALGELLIVAGLLPKNTRRAVIDIDVTGALLIYCEYYGDERWLAVDWSAATKELEIRYVESPALQESDAHPDT